MSSVKAIVYGLGGYDTTKPDNNLIEVIYHTEAELAAKTETAAAKAALLERLGITEEEAKLLLS